MPSWEVGVVLNYIGCLAINFGTNLMKLGHEKGMKLVDEPSDNTEPESEDEAIEKAKSTGIPKEPIWKIGFAIFFIGNTFNFVSLNFAPQSLLAALGSVQFVSNVWWQWHIWGFINKRVVIATIVIIIGNGLVVLCSTHNAQAFTTPELVALYYHRYKIYLFVSLIVTLISHFTYVAYRKLEKRGYELPGSAVVPALTYVLTSSIIGTQSLVQCKCASLILGNTFSGNPQLAHPFTYFAFIFWFFTTYFWFYRMNAALKFFSGSFIIPVSQVFWTFFSIITGGIYFKEFDSMNWFQIIGFIFAVMVVFYGVHLLAPRPTDGQELIALEDLHETNRQEEFEWFPTSFDSSPKRHHDLHIDVPELNLDKIDEEQLSVEISNDEVAKNNQTVHINHTTPQSPVSRLSRRTPSRPSQRRRHHTPDLPRGRFVGFIPSMPMITSDDALIEFADQVDIVNRYDLLDETGFISVASLRRLAMDSVQKENQRIQNKNPDDDDDDDYDYDDNSEEDNKSSQSHLANSSRRFQKSNQNYRRSKSTGTRY